MSTATHAAAIDAFKARDLERAHDLARDAWKAQPDFRMAALLAAIALERGDAATAYDWAVQAAHTRPELASLHLHAGRLALGLGRRTEAITHFRNACERDVGLGEASIELARLHAACGAWPAAMRAIAPALRSAHFRDRALQALLDAVPLDDAPGLQAPGPPARPATDLRASVIVCSIDPARLARAEASYRQAFGDWPWELVHVADARSLAEGYARGVQRATGELLVFSHDDVEIGESDLGPRLVAHLESADVVGVAGAQRVAGPAWSHAGHPWLHGAIAYPSPTGYDIHVYGLALPETPRVKVLDGALLVMRAATARTVGWDFRTFTGWHGYDVDFCLRADAMGCVLRVAHDLALVHHSRGTYDARWRDAAQALRAKHPALGGQHGATHAYARSVSSIEDYVLVMRRWRAVSALLPGLGEPAHDAV